MVILFSFMLTKTPLVVLKWDYMTPRMVNIWHSLEEESPLNIEKAVIEQLRGYKRLIGRIKVLEKYPVGNGMYLSVAAGEDKLQALHRELAGKPSYMYLNKREQEIEATAHSYLEQYPLGTRAQLREVRRHPGDDPEDERRLRELQRKIEKVIDARSGMAQGFDGVIERISELQEMEAEKGFIDRVFEVLHEFDPRYKQVLWLQYVEDKPVDQAVREMCVSETHFRRIRKKAMEQFAYLAWGYSKE